MGLLSRVVGRDRRPDLPDEARDLLGLAGKDRVLAWGVLAGGGWAAALTDRLVVLDPRGKLIDRPWTVLCKDPFRSVDERVERLIQSM